MRNIWRLYLLGLFLVGNPALSVAQQTTGEIEKAITALENQWLQSQKTNNPDIVAPLLFDKFVSTEADGKVSNKAQMLADAGDRRTWIEPWRLAHRTQLFCIDLPSCSLSLATCPQLLPEKRRLSRWIRCPRRSVGGLDSSSLQIGSSHRLAPCMRRLLQ